MHRTRTLVVAPLAALLALGCDLTVADESGEPSYGRIAGTVTRRDGSSYPDGTLLVFCGTGFGVANARTDAAGAYDVTVVAPGALQSTLEAAGMKAKCIVSAPSSPTPFARDSAVVTFAASAQAAPLVRLDLREP